MHQLTGEGLAILQSHAQFIQQELIMQRNPEFLMSAIVHQERADQLSLIARVYRDSGRLKESEVYQQQAARRTQWAMEDMGLLDSHTGEPT
jgi:hypothetical protein